VRDTDEHRQQWPDEYGAFKRGQEVAINGTPLEQWSVLKPAQVHELKLSGFEIVEDIRDMSDHAAQQIPQGHRLKQLAEAYLDDAASLAALTAAQAENNRQAAEIAALQREIENLREQNTQLFSQLQVQLNGPHPLSTTVVGVYDPADIARANRPQEPVQSALAGLPELPSRRRGAAQAEA
jgi:hypothetical protein